MSRTALSTPERSPTLQLRGFDWDAPCAHNDRQKDRFHRIARAQMRRLSDELGLEPGSYEIRSERGGPAVSGEVTLRHERFQVRASQDGPDGEGLLIRTCEGTRDLTGVTSEGVPLALLDDPEALADRIRSSQPQLDRRRVQAR